MMRGAWLGPVFAYEWLARSRRWQAYAVRGLFVATLLACLWVVWRSAASNVTLTTRQQLVEAGTEFYHAMTITQLALVLLAAPAATAGAICLDKARGTLAHVMVTDLSDREVVLGKLAARLVPVLNLIACALPVAALGTLLGGIDPVALTAAFLIAVGVALLGCSLALVLSVWMKKAHEVLIVVFATWAVWLLALPMWMLAHGSPSAPRWLTVSNPFWLTLAPYGYPGTTSLVEPVGFLLVCLALAVGLAVVAVARLRPIYLHQEGRTPKPVKDSRAAGWYRGQVRWWPGPSLDKNPVLWREWHRNRPSRAVRAVWLAYILITSGVSLFVILEWLKDGPPTGPSRELASVFNGFQASIGLLLLAASAGTALSEERVRGSLDVLLATPMTTRSIVWGKWWGTYRRVPWLAFWPGLIAFAILPTNASAEAIAIVYLIPLIILAQGAALVSLGLALATWIARGGRAIAWTVAALVASLIGWPVAAFQLFSQSDGMFRQNVVVMGSPFWNVGFTTSQIEMSRMMDGAFAGLIYWTLAYAGLALFFYLAALRSFDRCLGRTPERSRPGPRPGALPKPKARVGELDAWEIDRAGKVTA